MNAYQFDNFIDFFEALKAAKSADTHVEAFTPIHHEEVDELLRIKPRFVNIFFYSGGLLGIVIAMMITTIPSVFTFPINIGGRPLWSWPAFSIIAFELMILMAGLFGVTGFFFMNKFPRFDRGIFKVEEFGSRDEGEYFILTKEELRDVKARHHYSVAAP